VQLTAHDIKAFNQHHIVTATLAACIAPAAESPPQLTVGPGPAHSCCAVMAVGKKKLYVQVSGIQGF
jgi:hypothetical protein